MFNGYAKAKLPTIYGEFDIYVFQDSKGEHAALVREYEGEPVLVRVHSQCLTGDVFGSLRCDCGEQLDLALSLIANFGGILIYLAQEGRGIGLANKISAYALQEKGLDTVDANLALGFKEDERTYEMAAAILRYFGIKSIALLTNNPKKIEALRAEGFQVERVEILPTKNSHNERYIATKKNRMGHLIESVGDHRSESDRKEMIEKYSELLKKMKKTTNSTNAAKMLRQR